MKSQTLLSLLLLFFTSLSAAWPGLFEDAQPGALKARQNSQSQAQSTAASQTGSASGSASGSGSVSASASASATSSSGNNDNKSSGSGSVSASGSGSKSGSSTATSKGSSVTSGSGSKNSTKTAVDPRLPPGGVSMMTPAATDGMTFVKVGEQVTFKWNYTSLSFTPSYIDVIATNTVNSQTYTIAGNQSVEATQQVVWDTNQFTQTTDLPFVVATYTLMIYDANSEPTAVASAGYLNAFSNLQFGVYTPQAYTPLNEFRCSTCNSAMSLHEKQALGILLGTCTITILSFTWFASGVFHLF